MVMMTGLAITRERERGTMENLLAMPLTPLEVMTGKIVPYIAIGLVQATIILVAARYIFNVPFVGSITALYGASLLFIACNLTVGITLSSLGGQPAAGDAAHVLLLPAEHPAVGLHVPVSRHAASGRRRSAASFR